MSSSSGSSGKGRGRGRSPTPPRQSTPSPTSQWRSSPTSSVNRWADQEAQRDYMDPPAAVMFNQVINRAVASTVPAPVAAAPPRVRPASYIAAVNLPDPGGNNTGGRIVKDSGRGGGGGRGGDGVGGGGRGGDGVGGGRGPHPREVLKQDFAHLLSNFGKKAEGKKSYYQVKATVLAEMKDFTLEVDFRDLLKNKKYIPLAVEITKDTNPSHGWLLPTARDFMNTAFGLQDEEKVKKLQFCFINEPRSVKLLTDYPSSKLVKKVSIFDNTHTRRKVTHTGRNIYSAVLQHVLEMQEGGKTWNGSFESTDICIIGYADGFFSCLILADARDVGEGRFAEKVADWKRVNTLVTPRYELEDQFPAYFVDLAQDIEKLVPSVLQETRIARYFPFHIALMPLAAQRFLTWQLHLAIQSVGFDKTTEAVANQVFGAQVGTTDWRLVFRATKDLILSGVYNFENTGTKDKFSDTLKGQLDYKRNIIQHAHNYLKGQNCKVGQLDEATIFASWKVPVVLPKILGDIFRSSSSNLFEENKDLRSAWETFCSMRDGPDEDRECVKKKS